MTSLSFKHMSEKASRLRQRLKREAELYRHLVEQVLAERGPLIRGSIGTRARKCGKSGCRCSRGELHESKYLSASTDKGTAQVHVPRGDEVEVTAGVERYRRLVDVRRRMAEGSREHLKLVDSLAQELSQPYPADRPLPAARRRGRKPQGSGGGEPSE